MFFFLPLVCGFPTKVKPDGTEQTAHLCPRCNNASVFSAKSRTWFEFFFIPLIPMATKHIWMCGICRWTSPLGPGKWEPPIAYQNPHQSLGQGYITSNGFQPGYQPSYDQPPNNYEPNQK
ncbi:hypothetical protein J3R30DRAFT_3435953 [Lentinula aciculospora]|uniref:Zinc-ribbon 15 domain-containing protein n=1 Tax=Lentinula aciculospora TaxID=153920 RepID=A0A9W9ATK5_9AGAR|nr:hypothetical protein J3R30DRAFT_3435953 [Lentinula aciculospora]